MIYHSSYKAYFKSSYYGINFMNNILKEDKEKHKKVAKRG